MVLKISRDQAKAMLGGVSFELKAQVELTQEESDLIKKYKVHKEVLLYKEINIFGSKHNVEVKIGDLVDGQTTKCKDIATVMSTEENIKEACQSLKNYIEVMRTFGGQSVYEY